MKNLCFVLALMLLLSMSACQKTPEQEPVVIKDGKLEEIIAGGPMESPAFDFPQEYAGHYEAMDRLSIDIHASLILPDTTAYPVYSVAFQPFSKEQASNLIKSIYGDAPVYMRSALRSREEIQEEILHLKKTASEIAAGTQNGDVRELEKLIQGLEEDLAASSDTADRLYDGSMLTDQEGSFLRVYGNLGKAKDATLEIRNYSATKNAFMLFINGTEYWADGGIDQQAANLSTSPAEALALASQFLEQLGLTDFYPVLCRVGSAYASGDVKGSEGYVVACERYIENIPVTYNLRAKEGGSIDSIPDYSQQFNKEKITITLDDTGITTFKWENPICYEVKNSSVALLSFEDMLGSLVQGITYKYAWVSESSGVEKSADAVEIIISQIKLGFAVIPEKDHIGSYMLVPAWDFFGTETLHWTEETSTVHYDERSFVTINAIDGSMID